MSSIHLRVGRPDCHWPCTIHFHHPSVPNINVFSSWSSDILQPCPNSYFISSSGGATPGRARSNDLAGRSTALAPALAPPCLLLCFASVIVWTEYHTISDHFICFILTVKQSQRRWRPLCFEGDDYKRSSTDSRMFWPRNDLAPWRRHWSRLVVKFD